MHVYANATCLTTGPNGAAVRLTKGEAWAADDPVVAHRPHLFSTIVEPRRTTPAPAPVETASAEPGEKPAARRG